MSIVRHQPDNSDNQAELKALELEIAGLEGKLNTAEANLNAFMAQIRHRLAPQIERLHLLVGRYKKLKLEKKAKRLEQKQKGKHYKPPQQFPATQNGTQNAAKTPDQQDLKRLYKEAIVKVHPDKIGNENEEHAEHATNLTKQLNELYESGDLEELKGLHGHILSGNAFSHAFGGTAKVSDPEALRQYLQNKRNALAKALQEMQQSELYHVLQTYPDPLTFIPELKQQLEERITVFEKRTRKYKE